MNSEISYEQVAEMTQELKELLENHLLENPEIAAPFVDRALQIRQELESMGLLVRWKASMDPQTLKLCVEIDILKPRDNMTAEQQKLYDEWLLKKAGISLNIKN